MPKDKKPTTMRGKLNRKNQAEYLKKVGRPRTTINDIPKDWKERMITAASLGKGVVSYAVTLGIHTSAFDTLLEDSEEFRITYLKCQLLCQEWYEDRGRDMIDGTVKGSSGVWGLNMANRYNWRSSRQEIIGDVANPIQHKVSITDMSSEEVIQELANRGLPTTILGD